MTRTAIRRSMTTAIAALLLAAGAAVSVEIPPTRPWKLFVGAWSGGPLATSGVAVGEDQAEPVGGATVDGVSFASNCTGKRALKLLGGLAPHVI